MSIGHIWNDIDRGNPDYSEKQLCQCHVVHHKWNLFLQK